MVTGQENMTSKSNINLLSTHILSVQACLNGLSFCIIDTTENNIVFLKELTFKKQCNPIELEEHLNTEFESNYLLQGEFKKVILIHHNNLSTFIPKALFNERNLVDYLKFNNKIFESDFIAHDELSIQEMVSVYVPFVNINNCFFDRFTDFEYQHANTILVQQLLQKATVFTTKIYCNVQKNTFEMVYIKEGKLNLFNSFEYTTKEDFIYYLLFTIEQLQLNTETIELILLGNIGVDDDLYSICYQYIRNVSFGTRATQFMYRNVEHKPKYGYNHFALLSSFNN